MQVGTRRVRSSAFHSNYVIVMTASAYFMNFLGRSVRVDRIVTDASAGDGK